MINAFRFVIVAALGLIVWFTVMSENLRLERRAAVQNVRRSCTSGGQIAITLDDGPSQYTAAILDNLSTMNARATFHVVSKNLNRPDIAAQLIEAHSNGHLIGLRFPLDLNPQNMNEKELTQTLLAESAAIYNVINVYPKFLRFAPGQYGSRELDVATRMGLVVTEWNLDTNDYTAEGPSVMEAYAKALSKVGPGSGNFISVHHDPSPTNIQASIFSSIANQCINAQLKMVTLDVCTGTKGAYRESNSETQITSSAEQQMQVAPVLTAAMTIAALIANL